MRLNETIGKTTKDSAPDDAVNEKEGRRRLGSGLIVAFHAFVVAYAVFAVSFDHWGPTLGWMPSAIIAAAFGWFGYFLPWIGDAIVMLWDVLSILFI
ncbi:hypothetical protein [Afipia sp. GAS231]|uniref:hypothetical protein n=1 Tax=Afipia sp. GAS231 TaxID=1882747 RepID=UPI0008795823|nr:hypothetical protein [Afipia sp. GAS231]SDN09202.1 hypothetical protein SAMN05444050_0644 [Afipia sp. GAS231]